MAAILVGIAWFSLGDSFLGVLGDAVAAGLITYALLFYTVEAIKVMGTPGPFKSKLTGVLRLPILHTEPLALLVASKLAIYDQYNTCPAWATGPKIAFIGGSLCYFFLMFLLANFFLNIIKYGSRERLFGDEVKTGGLLKKAFRVITDHVVKSALILSLPVIILVVVGFLLKVQSPTLGMIKEYPYPTALVLVLPFATWLLLRLFRTVEPPFTVNGARLLMLAFEEIRLMPHVKTPGQFLEFLEKRNEMLKTWLKLFHLPTSIYREIAICNIYLSNYDRAIHYFQEYVKAFNPRKLKLNRELQIVSIMADRFRKTFYKKYFAFYRYEGIRSENFEHVDYLRPFKALENFEKDKKETTLPEMHFVYSLFLEMLNQRYGEYHSLLRRKKKERFTRDSLRSKSRLQWQTTIAALLAHPEEYQRENLGESFNVVFEISNKDYFKDAFVLKGQRDRESLEKERKNTEDLRPAMADFKKFLTPVPLHITEETIDYREEQIYVYAMRRSRGISVLEFIHGDGQMDILKDVAEYLAIIHTHMPNTGFKTDYRTKVLKKFNGTAVEPRITRLITKSMTPVIESLKDGIFVFGKDAHPGNWLAAEKGEIVALDMEDKGAVPLEIDLVNLLEFDDFGLDRTRREELKEHIIGEYVNYYKQYCGGTIKGPFSRLRYLNAVIQRMLCLYTFWSSSSRDSKIKRDFVLDNALYALNEISSVFNDYFSIHRRDYENLQMAINDLKRETNEEALKIHTIRG